MSNAPYEAFTSLSELSNEVGIGTLAGFDAWGQRWCSFSASVDASFREVREGFRAMVAGEVDNATWHVGVLGWPKANDDLSRAVIDFALRRLADKFEADHPELSAALLRMPHRRLKADETTAMTQLIMADMTPQKADEKLARRVVDWLKSERGESLSGDERAELLTAWEERIKKSLEPPPLPIKPPDPSKIADEEADNRKLFIIGVIIVAFLVISLSQTLL